MGTTDQGPPLVVCDAGPLIHLDELDALDLLADFAEVLVPDTVWREVAQHRPDALTHRGVTLRRITPRMAVSPERMRRRLAGLLCHEKRLTLAVAKRQTPTKHLPPCSSMIYWIGKRGHGSQGEGFGDGTKVPIGWLADDEAQGQQNPNRSRAETTPRHRRSPAQTSAGPNGVQRPRYSSRKLAETVDVMDFSMVVLSLIPSQEVSVEWGGVIWKTPILADRSFIILRSPCRAICSALAFASAVASASISSFASAILVKMNSGGCGKNATPSSTSSPLKNLGGWDYFDELLARIREIRAWEKRFHQKARDLFVLCGDGLCSSPSLQRAILGHTMKQRMSISRFPS